MIEVVLDSNILFAALISGKELYLDIFRCGLKHRVESPLMDQRPLIEGLAGKGFKNVLTTDEIFELTSHG